MPATDAIALRNVYHPGSWDDHGPMKMTGNGFADACVDSLEQVWQGAPHLLGQTRIMVEGNHAGAETTFHTSLTRVTDDGAGTLDQMVGRYVDQLQKRDGQWRIKARNCVSEWSSSACIGEDFLRGDLFLSGRRDAVFLGCETLRLEKGRARIER